MDFYFSFGKKNPSPIALAARAGLLWTILNPIIDFVLDYFNKGALKKFGVENICLLFNELDLLWLKTYKDRKYSESDARVIISMLVKFLEDEELTRKELLAIVDLVQRKWVKAKALDKIFTETDEVLDARIEATIDQAIDIYNKTYAEKPQTPEEFVASTAEIIFHAPDQSKAQELLGGMLEIKNKLIF